MSLGIASWKRGYSRALTRFAYSNLADSWLVRLVPFAALVAAASCSPVAPTIAGGGSQTPVASVTVSLAAPSVGVGQSTQAVAVTKDSSGNTLSDRTVTWSSANSIVASVTAAGLANGLAVGTAGIVATSEGQTGSATLTVTTTPPPPPAPVASVTVALGASSVSVGQATQATATLKDANGATLTGRTVTWASNNTAVATVNS